MSRRKKVVLTITLPKEIIDWIDKKIADLTFANKSHAIEKALREMKERMEKRRDEREED